MIGGGKGTVDGEAVYKDYAQAIHEMEKGIQASGDAGSPTQSVEIQMLKIEDQVCLKHNLTSIY